MTLHIHAVTEVDSSDLYNLVVDRLDSLLGDGACPVESVPPIEYCCLATSDAHQAPVLISFDLHDPQQALLTGLARLDQLGSETAALFLQQAPVELLILAPAAPPGQILFNGPCPVSWRRIQVLSVNGELGMVIDPVVEETATPARISLVPSLAADEPEFSEEEAQHFNQL
jgi:hypothetical protein